MVDHLCSPPAPLETQRAQRVFLFFASGERPESKKGLRPAAVFLVRGAPPLPHRPRGPRVGAVAIREGSTAISHRKTESLIPIRNGLLRLGQEQMLSIPCIVNTWRVSFHCCPLNNNGRGASLCVLSVSSVAGGEYAHKLKQ